MQHVRNFKRYRPESVEGKKIEDNINAIFLESMNGEDWYEIQSSFNVETIKVMYDESNIIRALTTDISKLYPEGCSVVEIDSIPENVTIDGNWQFKDDSIIPREFSKLELDRLALKQKKRLLSEADKMMSPLRDAVEMGMSTQEEESLYAAWRTYRVLLNRIDVSSQNKINWPVQPG